LFNKLLGFKLQRVFANRKFWDAKADRQGRRAKFGIVSRQILVEIVPHEALLTKNVKQILLYKERSKALQDRFRNYLDGLEVKINDEPWDDKPLSANVNETLTRQ
jgi:hypothetical protein